MTVAVSVRLAAVAALLVALASCATVPAPEPVATPPPVAATPAQAPVPPAPSPPPALVAAPFRLDGEPTFDIGLAVDRETLTVAPVGSATLSWRAPDGEKTAEIREPVRLRLSGAQVLVEPEGRPRAVPLAVLEARDTLWVGDASFSRGETAALGWNGSHWRGRFKLFIGPRGKLTLATRVSLERYLLGVVPGEIGALRDSLIEAGRAQAIAARSYTLFYRGRRGAEGFDLYATVEDQLYGPAEAERPLASRCVESTRGQASLFAESPIRANYCSTCGGITADVWEAWPTDPRGYLVSVADRGAGEGDHCALSPQYRWREAWPVEQFAATIARWAPAQNVPLPAGGVGEIRDVRVESRSHSGRVWRLRVETSSGPVVIPAYSLRQVLRRPGGSGAILRSNLFKIGVRRDAAGRVVEVVASGAGSGHGVGLCQTGALAMARGGASATRILGHYYAGTEVKRLY
jgi:stage II sporulation protein D